MQHVALEVIFFGLQEIQDLQSVAVPEHIGTNRTAQAARAARYPVTLSTFSFQLLMAFLQGAKLWLLLAIVNQHLKVQVSVTINSMHLDCCLHACLLNQAPVGLWLTPAATVSTAQTGSTALLCVHVLQ